MIVESCTEQDGTPSLWIKKRKGTNAIIEKITKFRPYFYVLVTEKSKIELLGNVLKVDYGFKSIFGEELARITLSHPKYVKESRSFFSKTYEADILFNNRYLIDEEPDFGSKPKFCYLDIEVDAYDGSFPEPKDALYPISAISFTTNYHSENYITLYHKKGIPSGHEKRVWKNRVTGKDVNWHVFSCESEHDILKRFVDFMVESDVDYFTGWNIDFFDMPYIINRAMNINFNIERLSPFKQVFVPTSLNGELRLPIIKGRGIFDMLIPYKKLNISQLDSYRLDRVGEKELNVEKLPYEGKLHELYREDIDTYLKYNIADVELVLELDKLIEITDYFFNLASFIGCNLGDTMSNSRMGDIYSLMYNKRKNNASLPTKTYTESKAFEGAIVIDPQKGLHNNIIVLDLSKIYPQIIIDCNMSPETMLNEIEAEDYNKDDLICIGNGFYFRKDLQGFSANVLRDLFKIEDEKKKDIKRVASEYGHKSIQYKRAKNNRMFVKFLRNSFYGLLSFKGYRMYRPDLGASVTYMGRQALLFCKEMIEKKGYTVVYGDTDSIFVQSKGDNLNAQIKEGEELRDFINTSFNDFAKKYNIDNHEFNIEFEKLYKTMILLSKKRYDAYTSYLDGDKVNIRDTKGLESKRSDNAVITKSFLNDILDLVHQGKNKNEIDEFVMKTIKTIFDAELEKISLPKAINKNIDEYQLKSAYVRGAIYANENLKTNFNKGSKPYFAYIKSVPSGYPQTDVLCFEDSSEIPEGFDLDYNRMIDLLIIKKVQRVYEVMGWSLQHMEFHKEDNKISITSQQSLDAY